MEENYAPAFYWLGKAAKKGNAEAQCRFSLLYSLGGDNTTARHWIEKAAAQGLEDAKECLREIFDELI